MTADICLARGAAIGPPRTTAHWGNGYARKPLSASSNKKRKIMIIVMGFIYIDPTEIMQFSKDIEAISPVTDVAGGCFLYSVTLVDQASGQMLVTERWHNQDALTAHLERHSTQAFLQKWGGKMRGEVLKYDAANERSVMA